MHVEGLWEYITDFVFVPEIYFQCTLKGSVWEYITDLVFVPEIYLVACTYNAVEMK